MMRHRRVNVGLALSAALSGPPLQFEATAMGESFPATAHAGTRRLPALLKGLAACDTATIVPISTPTVVGRATVLGRPTYVIDFGDRPCGWMSNSARAATSGRAPHPMV